MSQSQIHLGTSSFTAIGWNGSFYPQGMRSQDYLSFYAEHFDSVEVDSTFYACPTPQTVRGWFAKTPEKFVFSVKAPQTITHEQVLVDCEAELKQFIETMEILGNKLGPIVFQFPYFSRSAFADKHAFLDRLAPFLKTLPTAHRYAVELRNRDWFDGDLAYLLREHRVALVLQDRSWMSDPLSFKFDPITTDFTYIRWLGNRNEIEVMTQTWDRVVVDRTGELKSWVDFCQQMMKRGVLVYAYANNHFQGHGPATVVKFIELWAAKGFGDLAKPPARKVQPRLFD